MRLTNITIKYPKDWDEKYDVNIKSDKWKNLYFDKKGNSVVGYGIYVSEQHALNKAKECEKQWMMCLNQGSDKFIPDGAGRYFCLPRDYSHVIQLPWKD